MTSPHPDRPERLPPSRWWPRIVRVLGILAPVAVGVLGAWLGMLAGGKATITTGPFTVQLSSNFGRSVTDIALPPFGRLSADTHVSPLRFTATLTNVDVPELSEVIRTSTLDQVVDRVETDSLAQVTPFALRLLVVAVAGALILGLVAFRGRWRKVGVAGLVAVALVGGSEAVAWRSYRPAKFLSPTFEGSLSLAPDLIGPVRTATDRINEFRAELRRIVAGAGRIFTTIQSSPLTEGDEVRVLHISDVHLSPLGMEFALEIAQAFDVDFVLDTGDLTSFGTPAEELILTYVPRFGLPYVFVRGNHDSLQLQAAMEEVSNATVLDGETVTIRGVTLYGLGDPVFTPDQERSPAAAEAAELIRLTGERILADLDRLQEPPAILAIHNDRNALAAAGLVPLVVAGHDHIPLVRVISDTLFIRVGTTGGSGATVFTEAGGIPLAAEVLYFQPGDPASLVAFDVIAQSPESGSLLVERHLVEDEFGTLIPSPSPASPLPSPGDSPIPTSPTSPFPGSATSPARATGVYA